MDDKDSEEKVLKTDPCEFERFCTHVGEEGDCGDFGIQWGCEQLLKFSEMDDENHRKEMELRKHYVQERRELTARITQLENHHNGGE